MKILLPVVGILLLLASSGFASTIRVPSEETTIQAGIDAAADGDTVLVAAGIYTGGGNRDLDFLAKSILVLSESGPEVTVIDCEGTSSDPHRGFDFHIGEKSRMVLEGFTVTNGYMPGGGGIHCSGSSPIISNCIISVNIARNNGGGVFCEEGASPVITNCSIWGNSTTDFGGRGGGIMCADSSPTITNCAISGNFHLDICAWGGGIMCTNSSPTITGCSISENSAPVYPSNGGGIGCEESSPTIENCVISRNSAYGRGGGIDCYTGSSPTITNCVIICNFGIEYGGGISCCSGPPPIITNCTFSCNAALYMGGGIGCIGNSFFIITNCILWDDLPDEIHVDCGIPVVTYSNILGGWEGEGNIEEDPRFVPFPVRGFENLLRPGSPCIDAGDPSIEDALYDWHPRWPNWYPDGARSDMGAYGGFGNWKWLR